MTSHDIFLIVQQMFEDAMKDDLITGVNHDPHSFVVSVSFRDMHGDPKGFKAKIGDMVMKCAEFYKLGDNMHRMSPKFVTDMDTAYAKLSRICHFWMQPGECMMMWPPVADAPITVEAQ